MQASDTHACICTHASAYTHTHNEQVTDKESFEHVETWIREIKKFTNDSEVRIVVVGNKIDLASCRQVRGVCWVVKTKAYSDCFSVNCAPGLGGSSAHLLRGQAAALHWSLGKICHSRGGGKHWPTNVKSKSMPINLIIAAMTYFHTRCLSRALSYVFSVPIFRSNAHTNTGFRVFGLFYSGQPG